MARCDEGYLCKVCGLDVEDVTDSDLYLRYVIGSVESEMLHKEPELHLRCNKSLAQYIVDDGFEPVVAEGAFDKNLLDPMFVKEREILVTRGWRRLKEVAGQGLAITEYPLPEVVAKMQQE